MKIPVVSIILPVYNGADRLKETVASVISQSYAGWEMLVIDDGSADNTNEAVGDFVKKDSRVKYIRNEVNLGIQKTLNKGLREAKGEYIARIDDDDIWIDKDKLKRQVEFLEDNKDYVLLGTGAVILDEEGKELTRFLMPKKDSEIRSKILGQNCFLHSSVMFRKSFAFRVGGYNETVNTLHIEDYDLWLKLGTVGQFANLDIYSVSLAQRRSTISNRHRIAQARKSIFEVLRFKNKYPNFFRGFLVSIIRGCFFVVQKIISLDGVFVYKIKRIYKNF
ncbi:MAG: glycosyltransferase [Minisyncoccia bacterium]